MNPRIKMFIPATLIRRINRFVALVLIDDKPVEIYVPNTGRMSELALPGAHCLLVESGGKYLYKMRYIISKGFPVMIDSTLSNSLFAELLAKGEVSGLDGYRLMQREPVYGSHRFDYLLEYNNNICYAELKSCTLFHGTVASFPDAVSGRASSHIETLASTENGKLIILILNDKAEVFIPNFHTDYTFYTTLKKFSGSISISALKISYDENLSITSLAPVPILIPEVGLSGFFFAVYRRGEFFNVHVSGSCEDVAREVKKFRDRMKKGTNPAGNGLHIKIHDMPVLGINPDNEEIDSLFSTNGGSLAGNGSGGKTYRFTYDPSEREWFWDYILGLRFDRFSTNRTASSQCPACPSS